jgi:hypothetical protein
MKSRSILCLVGLLQTFGLAAWGADPLPGVPLTNEIAGIRGAASNTLTSFQAHINAFNFQSMGFSTVGEIFTATNGNPLLIFVVTREKLTNYLAGDFNMLLEPPPRPYAMVPVMVGANVKSAITLRLGQTPPGAAASTWVGSDWGYSRLIQSLVQVVGTVSPLEIFPNTIPFVVEIPMPRMWFVGYYDQQKKLVLRTTTRLDFGPISINHAEPMTQGAMQRLVDEARRYDPNLPN